MSELDKRQGQGQEQDDFPAAEEEGGTASPADIDLVAYEPDPEARRRAPPLRDPVGRFLAEARRYPRLSEAEERSLGRAVRERGDAAAARKLVIHNLRLVLSIAYRYRQAWVAMLDLFQEGSVGLMEAVRRWDPEVGTRFGSYAAYWIRACILRFLMTNARLIHVGNTRAGRKLFFRLEKERQKLLAAGYDPTPRLLAAKLEVDESEVVEVATHLASREVPLEPRPDDEGIALTEKLAATEASPEEDAARGELSDAVRRLMDRFEADLDDERERAIWREHLAATDDPVPLATLGQRYRVSKQRMGQIAERIKQRFRATIVRELGGEIAMSWQAEKPR